MASPVTLFSVTSHQALHNMISSTVVHGCDVLDFRRQFEAKAKPLDIDVDTGNGGGGKGYMMEKSKGNNEGFFNDVNFPTLSSQVKSSFVNDGNGNDKGDNNVAVGNMNTCVNDTVNSIDTDKKDCNGALGRNASAVIVRLMNIPMEAWSVNGISALASSSGIPLIMDEITTKMCMTWEGRIGFARVLVEISVEKEIKNKIEIIYQGKNVTESMKKVVDVEYAWQPSVCTRCKVNGLDVRIQIKSCSTRHGCKHFFVGAALPSCNTSNFCGSGNITECVTS
ncbi:ATPase, F1/V1/A1 complex, alpha/beta subunit [Tanacetum coccineum]|uniref:ATPase, F1/V1/A1 complex, alpha/beta subunit n=1 Tax=Tanacetum coccineum TaxID=301880 RepID=A0ABQ4ZL26_9ASTR